MKRFISHVYHQNRFSPSAGRARRFGPGLLQLSALLVMMTTLGAFAQELGETINPGDTGFAVNRPVLASACPHGCPWGELGEFVQQAMAPLGYEVILCHNCNRSYGPGLVSNAARPPLLDAQNLRLGSTTRVDAPVDFGITSTDNLAYAYRGTWTYENEGSYANLRLIARIDDPRWLLVAAGADSGITDLAQIAEQQLAVDMLVNLRRPAIQKLMAYYGLTEELITAWGGSIGPASIGNLDADFDVVISNNGGPSNNPESAYWTSYTQQHDLHFLSLPQDLLNDLATDELALERATAKWGLLRGVDRPIDTVMRNGHAIFARDDLSEEAAYDIARAVYRHREALGTYIRPYAYLANKVSHGFGVPLHPGARRYYEEMGFLQPACVPELKKLEPASETYRPNRYQQVEEGQIEEEYEFSCSALGTIYRTTFNLSRPANRRDFSGAVIVEPTHPSNVWPIRSNTSAYLGEAGHASVVVNSHNFAVERLVKPVNQSRYQSLSVPDEARLEQEILHQLGLAIKQGGLEIAESPKVILAGYSNTGGRVRNYIQYFQHRYDDVFDGYLVNQTAVGTLPGPIPDLNVPVIELQGERELIATLARNPAGLAYRREDSPSYRLYEVAGMSHLDTSDPARWSFPPSSCGIDNPSTFPLTHAWDTALSLLADWVIDGRPAPRAPRIVTDAGGNIVRDEHGNATGGMPSPQISVPVTNIQTVSPQSPANTSARCDMVGPQVDFSTDKLAQLYGNHRGYMRRLRSELRELIDAGWVLPLHRDEVLEQAAEVAPRFGN
ncbi:MAG: alpha/beta hydrolase domain-containing protein [Pseudohongiellaceae bacterium]